MTLVATPVGHESIRLQWTLPLGDWDHLRLVRGAHGTPVTQDDGTVLFDLNCGPSAPASVGVSYPRFPTLDVIDVLQPVITEYLDTDLTGSTVYYYALFIRVGADGIPLYPGPSTFPGPDTFPSSPTFWGAIDTVEALSVGDHGGAATLLNDLPGVYTSPGEVDGAPASRSDLQSFLTLFGFDLDRTQDLLNGLLLVRSPSEMDGVLLPAAAAMLDYGYEPSIGMRRNREMLTNAAYLNQHKGTALGITGLASAATSYGAVIQPLTNLMHDSGDATGAFTPTRWTIMTGGSLTSAVMPPLSANPMDPAGFPSFSMRLTGASATEVAVFPNHDTRLQGIPVNAGEVYTYSGYLSRQDGSGAASVVPAIVWVGADGLTISTSVGGSTMTPGTVTNWERFFVTDAAPAGAVWAGMTETYTTAAARLTYIGDRQFEAAAVASTYRLPRNLDIVLIADRTNLVQNAGFDNDVSQWGVRNATMTQALSLTTTVASGSNGGMISAIASWSSPSAGVLDVASTTGFPATGTVTVDASGATEAVISYTATTSNSFTGCTYVSGSPSGTVATGGLVRGPIPTFNHGTASALITPATGSEPPLYPDPTTFPDATTFPGGGDAGASARVEVTAGDPFVFAMQILSSAAANYQLQIQWLDASNTVISNDLGDVTFIAATTWTRIFMTAEVPLDAASANLFVFQTDMTTVPFYIDDVLGEQVSVLQDFFDSVWYPGDVLYTGTVGNSTSYYYQDLQYRSARLASLLPIHQIPFGSTFTLFFAETLDLFDGLYGDGIYGDHIYGHFLLDSDGLYGDGIYGDGIYGP